MSCFTCNCSVFLIKLIIDKILMAAYLFNFSCLPELETKGMVNIKSQASKVNSPIRYNKSVVLAWYDGICCLFH